jgi:hypothetical protein
MAVVEARSGASYNLRSIRAPRLPATPYTRALLAARPGRRLGVDDKVSGQPVHVTAHVLA